MPPDYNYGLQVSLHSLVAVEKVGEESSGGPLPQSPIYRLIRRPQFPEYSAKSLGQNAVNESDEMSSFSLSDKLFVISLYFLGE